jgi:hypothetical protein
MAGMMEAPQGSTNPDTPMLPILEQVEAGIEAKVPPKMMDAYKRIVAAGMKLAFDSKTNASMMKGLEGSQKPIEDIAVGTVGLILLMYDQSKKTMPLDAAIPAGMCLVLHGLDFANRAMGVNITNAEVDQATEIFTSTILPKFGITPEVLQKHIATSQSAMNNPEIMAKFKAQSGAR